MHLRIDTTFVIVIAIDFDTRAEAEGASEIYIAEGAQGTVRFVIREVEGPCGLVQYAYELPCEGELEDATRLRTSKNRSRKSKCCKDGKNRISLRRTGATPSGAWPPLKSALHRTPGLSEELPQ